MATYVQKRFPKSNKYKRVLVRSKYYDMVQEQARLTRARRDPRTGRLMGRYTGVPTFASDSGKYLVLTKDFDLNKDKRPDLFKGQIIARLKKNINTKPEFVVIKVDINKFKPVRRIK